MNKGKLTDRIVDRWEYLIGAPLLLTIGILGGIIGYNIGFDAGAQAEKNRSTKTLDSTLVEGDSANVFDSIQYMTKEDSMYVR